MKRSLRQVRPAPTAGSDRLLRDVRTGPFERSLAGLTARAGWSVVALDAGPFWYPDADRVSDERGSHRIFWTVLCTLCECLPQPHNRITLAAEADRSRLPVAHMSYSRCDNDQQLTQATQITMERIMRAAEASEVMTTTRSAHLVGGARMAARAENGGVDANQKVYGTENVYLWDGSVLPTQGSANPGLTIMALAVRLGAHLGL